MSTTDGRAIDEQQAEIIHIRAHNRLLSDTITAMQHEIDAHHVIAQTEYKELLELREIVRGLGESDPRGIDGDEWPECKHCHRSWREPMTHAEDCLWLRSQKYVEVWG